MPDPTKQEVIDEQAIKIKVLKEDRLRISDLLVDSMVERALDTSALRALVDATWPAENTTGFNCKVCYAVVLPDVPADGHDVDCAWRAGFARVAERQNGA